MATGTFLTWTPDPTAPMGIRLTNAELIDCPACGEPCGYLYKDCDTPDGECLSCRIKDDLIEEYEAHEQDEFWAPDAWDRADDLYHAQF